MRRLPMPKLAAWGAAAGLAALLAAGCSSALRTISGGDALPFANARQAEMNARALEDQEQQRIELQAVYERYIKIVEGAEKGSKFIDQARLAAAQIQKELVVPGGANYERAIQLLDDVIADNPTGYLSGRARSEKAAIRNNRDAIRDARSTVDNTPEDATDAEWFNALEAMRKVAASYESLRDYETAIAEYEKIIDIAKRVSKSPGDMFMGKAAEARFSIGNIYFYRYYNYTDGWGVFIQLMEEFPGSDQAKESESLLRDAAKALQRIQEDQAYILSVRNEKAWDYKKSGRSITPYELFGAEAEQAAQTYLRIAQQWEKPPLVNRIAALKNYQQVVELLWSESFVAGDAAFHVGRLYQDNGDMLMALQSYDEMFDKFPQSIWHNLAVYNRAVCLETIREFEEAYREYKAAAGFGTDEPFYRAAEQKIRQYEQDQDGDGYLFYQEQQHGSSDLDKESYPGSVKPPAEPGADLSAEAEAGAEADAGGEEAAP